LNYAKKILRRVKLDGVNNKDLYSEKSEGEDWEGFNKLMRSSEIKDRRRITKIVNSVEDLEKREQAIRDMAEIYDAIEKDVLPQLRKAQITVRSFEPKKSDTEISELANTNPSELDVKELLYSASLTENIDNKISIYTQASEIHSNWKGYNNIACLLLENGNINEAEKNLLKAEKIDKNQSKISNNKAVIAAWKGNLPLAKKLYDNLTTQKNKALLDLRMANYKKASRFFKNKNTHNAALAKILNGQNSNCNENTAACDYLNAISYARSANESMLLKSLKNAISKNINYKLEAQKDLEFVNYKENEAFKSLVN
jgi:tetratricopeptide (TPR) repeat protein